MKLNKILLIITIVLVSVAVGLFIAGAIVSFYDYDLLSDIFLGSAAFLGIVSLGLIIYSFAKSFNGVAQEPNKPKVIVKIVDVKDLPKSKEEQLFEQYEDLYKQGLISKEDLEEKRKDLIQK